jgi:hypothetical protein
MRTGKVLVTACFVVLAAAACGAPTGGSASAGSTLVTSIGTTSSAPSTTSTAPTTPITTPGKPVAPPIVAPPTAIPVPTLPRSAVPPGQISSVGMTNPPQGVQVTNNGLDVVFNAEQSGCQQITAQVQSQTSTTVTVLVVTTVTSRGGQMCPMIVRDVQVAAQLGTPLGNRKLVFTAVTKHN